MYLVTNLESGGVVVTPPQEIIISKIIIKKMNVIKCSECKGYVEAAGESYYMIYEQIKDTRDKQCILKLCRNCYKKQGVQSP